jgi:chitinase
MRAMSPSITVAVLVMLALATAPRSGADFTASASSPGNHLAAAADFNTVTASLADPGATLQGTVPLTATAASERGIATVRIQAATAGSGTWSDVCVRSSAPYQCSWATTGDGHYDLRAVATDTAGYTRTDTVASRTVDNLAPAVALTNPGAYLGGTVTLNATASDAGSGVQDVTIQQRAQGATTWTDVCLDTTAPYSCSLNTTALPDGYRELRAVGRDRAGHTTQTALVGPRVDNTAPAAGGSVPPAAHGSVTMTATASDSESGIASVSFEALYAGTWYPVCVVTTAPYSCSADSHQVADGNYSLRLVITNGAGVKTTSATFPISVDNSAPTGVDVQTGNGGATPGQLESGDWLKLTWSEPVSPASVLAGWTGASQAVRVKISANDELDVYDATGTTRLGLVATATDLKLGRDFVTADAEFDATMVQSANAITITLGALRSGTLAAAPAAAGTLTWKPSAAATDAVGNAATTTLVTETGALDVDF